MAGFVDKGRGVDATYLNFSKAEGSAWQEPNEIQQRQKQSPASEGRTPGEDCLEVWQTESRTWPSNMCCEQRQMVSWAILTGTKPEDWREAIISFYIQLVRQHLEYCVLVFPVQEHQTRQVWWRATKTVRDCNTCPMRGGSGNQAHSAWRLKGFREA